MFGIQEIYYILKRKILYFFVGITETFIQYKLEFLIYQEKKFLVVVFKSWSQLTKTRFSKILTYIKNVVPRRRLKRKGMRKGRELFNEKVEKIEDQIVLWIQGMSKNLKKKTSLITGYEKTVENAESYIFGRGGR